MEDFVLQTCCELKRKSPHHGSSQHNDEFGSARGDFQLEIVGLFVYLYALIAYKN